jgi:signal transduction histidine kinase
LLAVSDLHVTFPANREFVAGLRAESPGDWLIVAGDVAEKAADIEWALRTLAAQFAGVVWVPGNHELWTVSSDPVQLRGDARYRYLVSMCRRLGVLTPEDPFPVWRGPGGQLVIVPLFLLYDYSFRPDGATTKAEALAVAYETGIVCSDEAVLYPDPYPSREAWCHARVEATRRRLRALPAGTPTILVSHFPLTREPTRVLRYPEFAQWCGTERTADWHLRYGAQVVVYGHLHIPGTTWQDGVRFEEVSLGYPEELVAHPDRPRALRQILPATTPADLARMLRLPLNGPTISRDNVLRSPVASWWGASRCSSAGQRLCSGDSVAAGSDRHNERSLSELRERFIALVNADRSAILASFAARLEDPQSPLAADPASREQAMVIAAEITADMVARIHGDDNAGDDRREVLAWLTGAVRTNSQLSPADLLRTAVGFFDVTVSSLARYVKDEPELLPCFTAAVLALDESTSRRINEAIVTHTGYLLERVNQAHIDERMRIARDLHDRLGEGLSIALRQLELHEIDSARDPATPPTRATVAKEAVTDAMGRLRAVTTDLRQDPVRSLETALVKYLDSAAADAEVRLRVSGDEGWAPPAVLDEAYQIIREALRNAFTHGSPTLVLISVTIAPHQLSAWVEDDGRGFEAAKGAESASAGTGLASMRERAAAAGGRLTLASVPGRGTYIGLVIPLPGHHHDHSG